MSRPKTRFTAGHIQESLEAPFMLEGRLTDQSKKPFCCHQGCELSSDRRFSASDSGSLSGATVCYA